MRLPFLDRFFRKETTKPRYAPRRKRVLVVEDEGEPDATPAHRGFLSDRRSRFTLIAAIVAIVVTGTVMMIERRLAATATDARPDRPAQVALGRTLYRQHCSYCHGVDREGHEDWRPDMPVALGLAPPLDERSPAVDRSDRQVFEQVKFGGQPFLPAGARSQMPAFEFNLTDAQVWALVAYLKNRWPDEALARRERANRGEP
ncbi:MAG: cytochrome c [Alphaproteobacteria bacterium]|nr:cytochrome c [Alphaproteobacteria bacterium]